MPPSRVPLGAHASTSTVDEDGDQPMEEDFDELESDTQVRLSCGSTLKV